MTQILHISTTTVRPTTEDDQLTALKIELSPWDLRLIQFDYIQKGILFHKSAETEDSNVSLVQRLKDSLSLTLNIFYPLAGRLVVSENAEDSTVSISIKCNGAGAEFVHAAAGGVKVADILNPYIPDHVIFNLFSLNEVRNYEGVSKPLLSAQVTELLDGIFIGCSLNHVVADGTSFWHFFNTWAEICRSGSHKILQPRPVFGRQFLDGVIDLPVHLPFSYSEIIGEPIIKSSSFNASLQRVVFHFPKEKIAKLKAKANAEMGTTSNISSLQALMAHLWQATTRARHLQPDQQVNYRFAIGLRQRWEPETLPKEYLGTAIIGVNVTAIASELLQNGLGWAASQINKKISSLTPEQARNDLVDWVNKPTLIPNMRNPTLLARLLTGSSPRFNVYGNDFGWGRPLAVRSGAGDKMDGKLTVFPGAEEGSIDFEACLLPETIQTMMDDAEFMEAVA
ncbi:PREDICTED: acetyltransferase [Prunus dulcis]|uniref:PREDICTED: acetyltransferase n=1 Tax=Prunus dulcis TaxID=3755 RepID=A0A5E4E193_PRUDU|nr:uncharacterized acetyltransferase At3g50280-like [Prunus dulcis]KAI5319292.1 hypothetical protein L3X38_039000 [Prunus dulcis]VVA09467.1 PREDICTED: acetyltransferase [Prunus dulcis]